MSTDRFVIDGICHPYNFSEENLKVLFGCIFNDVLDAFHPLLNLPDGLAQGRVAALLAERQGPQDDVPVPSVAEEKGDSYRRQFMELR